MASSKEYLDYILEQLSELSDITYKAMMGEYIIYYHAKIVGGIYDELPAPKVRNTQLPVLRAVARLFISMVDGLFLWI